MPGVALKRPVRSSSRSLHPAGAEVSTTTKRSLVSLSPVISTFKMQVPVTSVVQDSLTGAPAGMLVSVLDSTLYATNVAPASPDSVPAPVRIPALRTVIVPSLASMKVVSATWFVSMPVAVTS